MRFILLLPLFLSACELLKPCEQSKVTLEEFNRQEEPVRRIEYDFTSYSIEY